jgi:hypothetical protein
MTLESVHLMSGYMQGPQLGSYARSFNPGGNSRSDVDQLLSEPVNPCRTIQA